MNERITELANKSANEIADLFHAGFFDDRMVHDVAEINKQFAELIVRECIDILEKRVYLATREDGEQEYIDVVLLEYFGIEQ